MQMPKVTPEMMRVQPDQFCAAINRVIEYINNLEKKK